jgi:cell division protein FtsW
MGVPARFMRPRLIMLATVAVLVAFGLLMIYSASSITALNDMGDAAYYLKRQLFFVGVGVLLAWVIAKKDYHFWIGGFLRVLWIVIVGTLLVMLAISTATNGATRWLSIGGVTLQPSEFAKPVIILTAANILQRYAEDGSLDTRQAFWMFFVGVGAPLALIMLQPDKGTTMICVLTILVMLYMAGFPGKVLGIVTVALGVAFLAFSLADDYSRQRIITLFDPWADPYGSGYQLIQGFYAFGSGGILGVGIGMSRQKYGFLPYAYNDFIFAVIGEECGLWGTLGVVIGFALIVYTGMEIARYAQTLPASSSRRDASRCSRSSSSSTSAASSASSRSPASRCPSSATAAPRSSPASRWWGSASPSRVRAPCPRPSTTGSVVR